MICKATDIGGKIASPASLETVLIGVQKQQRLLDHPMCCFAVEVEVEVIGALVNGAADITMTIGAIIHGTLKITVTDFQHNNSNKHPPREHQSTFTEITMVLRV